MQPEREREREREKGKKERKKERKYYLKKIKQQNIKTKRNAPSHMRMSGGNAEKSELVYLASGNAK